MIANPECGTPDSAGESYANSSQLAPLRECPDCGLLQRVGEAAPGSVLECRRCAGVLRRGRTDTLRRALALNLTGIALYVAAAGTPLLAFSLQGREVQTTLAGLPEAFEDQGTPLLALILLVTTLVAPLVKLLLTTTVLLRVRQPGRPQWLVTLAWAREHVAPWSMIEVFLLGAFVAYTRLEALATVHTGPAIYALGALMLTMIAADAALDEDTMWDAVREDPARPLGFAGLGLLSCNVCHQVSHARQGAPCPRCGSWLRRRKPRALAHTWGLLLGAAVLYVPANVYPVMIITQLGKGGPHTILGGAEELLQAGLWPLALLVLVASILVPMLKLIGLGLLLVTTQRGSTWRLRDRTRLYRLVDVIGRWSMIDVFMVGVLVALVQMGVLATIRPGLGAVFFAGVVVLTMFAASSFDPRLMWDAAGRGGADVYRRRSQRRRAAAGAEPAVDRADGGAGAAPGAMMGSEA